MCIRDRKNHVRIAFTALYILFCVFLKYNTKHTPTTSHYRLIVVWVVTWKRLIWMILKDAIHPTFSRMVSMFENANQNGFPFWNENALTTTTCVVQCSLSTSFEDNVLCWVVICKGQVKLILTLAGLTKSIAAECVFYILFFIIKFWDAGHFLFPF